MDDKTLELDGAERRAILGSRRYRLGFLLLAAVVLIVSGVLYYRAEIRRVESEQYQELNVVAELKTAQVCGWRKERRADLKRSLNSPYFRDAVEELRNKPHDSRLQERMRERLRAELDTVTHVNAMLLTMKGDILSSAAPPPDRADITEPQLIEESLRTGQSVIGRLRRSTTGVIYIDTVGVVRRENGAPLAVLVLRSDSAALLEPLMSVWPTGSKTAETLLVRKEGNEVLLLNNLRREPHTALLLRIPLTEKQIPSVQAVLGKQGWFRGRSFRGVEVLADVRPVPESSWFMVAQVDAAEVMAEIHYRAGAAFIAIFLLLLLTVLMTAYIYRYRQAGLYRSLYRTERTHREYYELLRITLYSIGEAVITTDPSGRIRQMNPVAEHLTGWTEAEAAGKLLDEVLYIVDETTRQKVERVVERVLSEKSPIGFANHVVLISKDGSEYPIADSGAPICSSAGDIMGIVLVFRDQTKERIVQKALRDSEEKYRRLFEDAVIGVFRSTPDGGIVTINRAYARMFGYSSPEELVDDAAGTFIGLYADPDQCLSFSRMIEAADGPIEMESVLKRKDGSTFVGGIHVWSAQDGRGIPILEGFVEDISVRKLTEEAMQASLKEKETLLKEIHHRVKNNLQIMSSLLNIQSQHLRDPQALEALRVSVDRIRSMALLHEKLYRSEALSKVSFPGYIEDLTRYLVSTYASGRQVALKLDVTPVFFDIDTAIPVGLIVSELVTNSIKHAFPEDREGTITIGFHMDGSRGTLFVADTGIGFPDDMDFRKTESMGMQLVVILVEQLEGTLELKRDGGTEFRVSFNTTT